MDSIFWKSNSSAGNINGLADSRSPNSANIQSVRTDLAAWSAGKPKAVQNAVANLDGWLAICSSVACSSDQWADTSRTETSGAVNVFACTARAVETLRAAVTGPQHHQVPKHQ